MRTTRPPLRALIYAAVLAIANPLTAPAFAESDLDALRSGEMKKLAIHQEPKPVSDAAFTDWQGNTVTLADFEGRTILLNFWATWCAPCRKEMPSLDALQAELGSDQFEVVIVATGRNNPAGITKFFETHGITRLQSHLDPKSALARDMGVLGLPITLIIDASGHEIARLRGDADWHSDDAKAILAAILAGS